MFVNLCFFIRLKLIKYKYFYKKKYLKIINILLIHVFYKNKLINTFI